MSSSRTVVAKILGTLNENFTVKIFTVLTPSPGSINPLRYFPCVILLIVIVIVLAGRGVGEVVDRCDSLKV